MVHRRFVLGPILQLSPTSNLSEVPSTATNLTFAVGSGRTGAIDYLGN